MSDHFITLRSKGLNESKVLIVTYPPCRTYLVFASLQGCFCRYICRCLKFCYCFVAKVKSIRSIYLLYLKTLQTRLQKKKKKWCSVVETTLTMMSFCGYTGSYSWIFLIDCWVISEIMHHIAPNSANENAYIAPM